MLERIFRGALGVAFVVIMAGCSEQVTTSLGCPELCTDQSATLRDTLLTDVVLLDSSIVGFPLLGTPINPALVSRGDTADIRAIIRFDTLDNSYRATGAATDSTVRRVDSATVIFLRDTSVAKPTAPIRIDAFDVDTTANDTMPSALLPLFRADRLLGSVSFAPGALTDTVRIPLNNDRVLAKITAIAPLRIGLRISNVGGAGGEVRTGVLRSTQPLVRLRVSADTLVPADTVRIYSRTPAADPVIAASLELYSLRASGALPQSSSDRLTIGGVAGARSYLRLQIPAIVLDSVQIIRASLQFTQRPSRIPGGSDDTLSVFVQPVTASPLVTDLFLLNQFLGVPAAFGLETQRLVPRDSGERSIEIVNLVRIWRTLGTTNDSRAIVLRALREGTTASEISLFSSDAPAAVRPRLRLTYVPRRGFGLP